MMPLRPRPLAQGSTIVLAATARAVDADEVRPATAMLQSWGFRVKTAVDLFARDGQLAGTDKQRAASLQCAIDDPQADAILCCRGGYGTVRIVDRVDFSSLHSHPKWIVGYSDVTVLHSHLHAAHNLATLHATMPINFPTDGLATAATESLRRALLGEQQVYTWQSQTHDCPFQLDEAMVVGGNLSILYSLLGSRSQIDPRGKVLLIEDLDEYIYHIDRMMQALARAGMLDGLAALLVGGLTDMHDNSTHFGRSALQVILEAVEGRGYPVIVDAPFGHLGADNLALPLGTPISISRDANGVVEISL